MKDNNNNNYKSPEMSDQLMFKTIMDQSLDSIYFKDKDSRFFAVSKNKALRHGLPDPSEMIGKTDFDYISKSDAQKIFEEEKSILETGSPIIGKNEESTWKDGCKSYASVSKYPLYDENGKIVGIWGISRDITEYELIREALRESEERYSQLSEQNRAFTWEVDEQGLYTYVDHMSEVILGYPKNEMINKKHFYDMCPEDEREILKQGAFDVFKRRELFQNLVNKALTKGGDIVWLSTNGIPIIKDDGNLSGYRGSDTDITERKLIEDRLKKSEEKFKSYIEKAPMGIFITDEKGKYIEVNQAACQMTGYSETELLNLTIADFMAPESYNDGLLLFEKMMKEGYAEGDIIGRKKNNEKYWAALVSVKLADNQMIGFCKDISAKKEAEEQILYLSYHDQLTGLFNRRFYEEELQRLDVKRNLPMTIILGDVNGLKMINDSFGHIMGDDLLKKAAEVIKKECRADDIISRLGGDEFVILLPKTNAIDADHIIARFNELLLKEVVASITGISIAFGYAIKNDKNENIQETFKSAENMMYSNKRSMGTRKYTAIECEKG
ncbi:MAG: PAS domain S-box protein [Saccharofermentanales bacterium]